MTQMNLSTERKRTHRHREQTCRCGAGGEWSGSSGLAGANYYIEWITTRSNKETLFSIP